MIYCGFPRLEIIRLSICKELVQKVQVRWMSKDECTFRKQFRTGRIASIRSLRTLKLLPCFLRSSKSRGGSYLASEKSIEGRQLSCRPRLQCLSSPSSTIQRPFTRHPRHAELMKDCNSVGSGSLVREGQRADQNVTCQGIE